MTTYTYEQVWASRTQTGKCPVCGKRAVRKYRECNTVNPLNKNPDGSVRSRAEVRACVEAEADRWVPDFRHEKCLLADLLAGRDKVPTGRGRAGMTARCPCGGSLNDSVSLYWCSPRCQHIWCARQARCAYRTVDALALPPQGYTGQLAAATVLVVGRACTEQVDTDLYEMLGLETDA